MNLALAYEAPVALRHDPAPHFNAFLLNVDFASAAGDEWSATGGGDSLPEAIAAARDALPAGLEMGAGPLEPPPRRLTPITLPAWS